MAIVLNTNGNDVISANGYNQAHLMNAIINGNFQVNQRAKSGTVTLTAGQYGHDRWKAGTSGCTYTFATVENVTTITITAGSLIQVIEGINLETGTYVLSWNGTAQGKIGAGSYSASGITGSVTGGTNLNIEFGTGTISKVRFNKGSTPIEWQTEAYADVLDKCENYYRRIESSGNFYFLNAHGTFTTSTQASLGMTFDKPMRTTPTSITYNNLHISDFFAVGGQVTSLVLNTSTKYGIAFTCTAPVPGTFVVARPAVLYTHAGGGYIAIDCEL